MKLSNEKWNEALRALRGGYEVFLPAGEGDRKQFRRWDGAAAPNFEGNTTLPPKDLLFPRSESLYHVDPESKTVRENPAPGKKAVVGIRPCDVRGIENLDAAFTEKGYTDTAYARRREGLTIIALACTAVPSPACFCDSMGGGPLKAPGADVLLTGAEDGGYTAEFFTEKGKEIEALWRDFSDKGAGLAAEKPTAPPLCALRIDKPADLAEKLAAAFEDEKWERFSEACLGCGCCSYICPTCYCFDIDSEQAGKEASAFRCWDSCMFPNYTQMAGGHNPRRAKHQRLRNRYLHKLAYFDERYGRTLCVGCGRCIDKCPAGLDITAVMEWGGTL